MRIRLEVFSKGKLVFVLYPFEVDKDPLPFMCIIPSDILCTNRTRQKIQNTIPGILYNK